jgi:hypothetical protein
VCVYVCVVLVRIHERTGSTRSHQFGQAPPGEDTAWAAEVQVARAPAPHVQPLHSVGWCWALLPVQQDQLLLGTHSCALQHPLQLGRVGPR